MVYIYTIKLTYHVINMYKEMLSVNYYISTMWRYNSNLEI